MKYKFLCRICGTEMKLEGMKLVCPCGRTFDIALAMAAQRPPFVIAAGSDPYPEGSEFTI